MNKTITNKLDELLDGNKEIYRIDYLINSEVRTMHIIANKDELSSKLISSGFITFDKLSIKKDFSKDEIEYDFRWIDNFTGTDLYYPSKASVYGYKISLVGIRANDIKLVAQL